MKTWIPAAAFVAAALALLAADQPTLDRGKKEEAAACSACHSLRLVDSQRLPRATWSKEIDKMAGWGAKVQDRQALLEYLATTYSEDKPPAPPEMTKNGASRRGPQ